MKHFLVLVLLLISNFSSAETTILSCSFDEISSTGNLYIALNSFNKSGEVSLNYDQYTDYEGEPAAFSYEGDQLEWLWSLALSWDGQHVEVDTNGNMIFSLDSDGCDFGKIQLYGNNDFKYGFVSVDHACGAASAPKNTFSKASCSVVPTN